MEYELGSEAHRVASERAQADLRARAKAFHDAKTRADRAEKELAELKRRTDRAEAALKQLGEKMRADAQERFRRKAIAKAQAVLGREWKADGKTNRQIVEAVIGKVYPKMRLDSLGKEGLKALWLTIPANAPKRNSQRRDDGVRPFPGAPAEPAPVEGARTLEQVRRDAMLAQEQRAHRPLALSRRDMFKQLSSHPMLQAAQLEVMK